MPVATEVLVPGPDRRFLAMLGLSLALHIAALAWVEGSDREVHPVLAALDATLRLMPPIESGPAPADRPQAAPLPALQKARQFPSRSDPRPVRFAEGAASPPIAREVPLAPVAGELPATSDPAAAPAAAAVAAVPGTRDQAALLERYGFRLSELLSRAQEYPRLAALRGWEGEVHLRLKVARKGNLLGVEIDRSSGHEILDRHALQLLRQIPALPPLPEGLPVEEIQVVVPVNYRLGKAA